MGKVYLVGAGPGDVGLLTLKGMEKLRACDAVIYDRLASEELLDFVSAGCEKIYVGKQSGKHTRKQDEINQILVDCAKRHTCVVRLKGGDSFVFGRGGEEIESLEKEGIPYELVPGVTSAVAVPECAGIPLTGGDSCIFNGAFKSAGDCTKFDKCWNGSIYAHCGHCRWYYGRAADGQGMSFRYCIQSNRKRDCPACSCCDRKNSRFALPLLSASRNYGNKGITR